MIHLTKHFDLISLIGVLKSQMASTENILNDSIKNTLFE